MKFCKLIEQIKFKIFVSIELMGNIFKFGKIFATFFIMCYKILQTQPIPVFLKLGIQKISDLSRARSKKFKTGFK